MLNIEVESQRFHWFSRNTPAADNTDRAAPMRNPPFPFSSVSMTGILAGCSTTGAGSYLVPNIDLYSFLLASFSAL